MPRKFAKKRNYRRKRKQMVKYVPRTLGPLFPQNMVAKHKWTQKFDLTITGNVEDATTANSWDNIRCYNVYDPQVGLGSGAKQAMFYDDMKAHYAAYQVLGAKINVRFVNKGAGPIYGGLFRSTEGIAANWTMTQLRERGFGGKKQRIIGGLNTGREVANFQDFYSLKKTLGVSSSQAKADRDNYIPVDQNSVGNTTFPSQLWAFYVALVDKNLQEGDVNVEAYVTVDYLVNWTDRTLLSDASS